MPVVLTGDQVPQLLGARETDLAAFRWGSTGWQRIPLQVDPVRVVDLCKEVPNPFSDDGTWPEIPADADPAVSCEERRIDFSGQLEGNGELDDDDQIVFLIKEAGVRRPDGADVPAGAPGPPYEIYLRDDGADPVREGYVYLFADTTVPEPPGYSFDERTRTGRLAADTPPPQDCSPEENQYTTIETDQHCLYFATRWSLDDLVLKGQSGEGCDDLGAGAVEGPLDLLDRWKGHENDMGSPVDDDYWGCLSSFADRNEDVSTGRKTGPVRHVRGVLGAKSGVTTTTYTHVYPRYVTVETRLRVHEMAGIARLWDWNDNVLGRYDALTELAGGERFEDRIDGELSEDCEVVPGRFDGACVRRRSLRDAGPGADAWSLLAGGPEAWRPFVYTRFDRDPLAFTKDPALDDTFEGMQHFYADHDGPGQEKRLNTDPGQDEVPGSPGNVGFLFDLRAPYESCVALCGLADERCRRGPSSRDDQRCYEIGTYYQPLTVRHAIHVLDPSTTGEDGWAAGSERARLEREPVTLSIRFDPGSGECRDGDGDGWGAPNVASCPQGPDQDDCDDGNPDVNPGAPEVPGNGVDDDCDGAVDEAGSHTDALSFGWNLVAAPLDLVQTASEICEDVAGDGGSPDAVRRWDGTGWTEHRCGAAGSGFTVSPGESFFVRVSDTSTWTRRADDLPSPFELRLVAGWNALGTPRWAAERSAGEICDEIAADGGAPEAVSAWSGGRWRTHVCGRPFESFEVGGGGAIFVETSSDSAWTVTR